MSGSPSPRVLLIGAGVMGGHHGRVISESLRCELAAVVDPDEDRGRGLADRCGTEWMPQVSSFSRIDAVVVASPTDQHHRMALDALAEGIPLLVEKPLCAGMRESTQVVDVALSRGIPLMCGFVERFNPAVIEALSRMENPKAVEVKRFSSPSPRMHAGVAWDLLVHDIDVTLRLFGEEAPKVVRAATARCRDGGGGGIGEDVVDAELEFSGGRSAALSASRVSSRRVRRLVISEPEREIVADLLNRAVAVHEDGEVLERVDCSAHRDPLAAQWDSFLDLVAGGGEADMETCSILPSHEAVAEVLDAAHDSPNSTLLSGR